uniref:Uncharacterized protein n=1 Tax=Calcidiscus leptoporus TaxID=127549 RepID=A0A7S0P6J3_9EUKA
MLCVFFICGGNVTHVFSSVADSIVEHVKAKGATVAQRIIIEQSLVSRLRGFFIFALAFNLDVSINFVWALICTIWATLTIIVQNYSYYSLIFSDGEEIEVNPPCTCLTQAEVTARFADGNYLVLGNSTARAEHAGLSYNYPVTYGVGCAAHDAGFSPFCDSSATMWPTFCAQAWCYVADAMEAQDCTTLGQSRSVLFAGLFYSYAACKGVDSFQIFQTDNDALSGSSARARHG